VDASPIYLIRIAGALGPALATRFEGFTVTVEGGDTLITGPGLDQSALHGLLRLVRDLALPLVAVTRVDPRPDSRPDSKEPSA